mmetsp:Transcript_42387/g.76087  ORF Transcript_42387/g.76087 Transcript_42387/m.76087 type:complete len:128 (+) Transcript_42387:1075-1458(+)
MSGAPRRPRIGIGSAWTCTAGAREAEEAPRVERVLVEDAAVEEAAERAPDDEDFCIRPVQAAVGAAKEPNEAHLLELSPAVPRTPLLSRLAGRALPAAPPDAGIVVPRCLGAEATAGAWPCTAALSA